MFRFCCLPLMIIEVYFRRQLSYLQIGLILPRLVLLSERADIEQPLIYSNFRPISKAWPSVKSLGFWWGLFILIGTPWELFRCRSLRVILCLTSWTSIWFTHMEISILPKTQGDCYQISFVINSNHCGFLRLLSLLPQLNVMGSLGFPLSVLWSRNFF